MSPATQPNGLPRISRYTNPLQLDWALARYAALAVPTEGGSPDLAQQACQGWRRMAFDLASARMFPKVFRMSAENSGLMATLDELPQSVSRHPLPTACAAPIASAPPPPPPPPAPAPPSADQAPPIAPSTAVAQATDPSTIANGVSPTQTASAAESAAAPAAPAAPVAPQPATPSQAVANPGPATPAVVVRAPQDAASQEWQRLLTASAVKIAGQADWPGSDAKPDMETLGALAESAIPEIRLRARYHLLGHCANATVQQERLGGSNAVAKTACWGNHGQEPLHVTQGRLLRSMLSAWRFRGPEPMSDLVVALASFASRDNPVLDGPRISR